MRIEENTFLVAGGGSGLGEATARSCYRRGQCAGSREHCYGGGEGYAAP
jgi:NAD(P)-dependent dehydrogenase (short-subunit alcohol dehydrogenase family)